MSRAEQAKKEFEVILKFFGIPPTGNFMNDLTKLTNIELKPETIENNLYRFMFNCYDSDGSGTIDASELKQVLVDIGHVSNDQDLINISESEVVEALKYIDKDGNGTVDFNEFMTWMQE